LFLFDKIILSLRNSTAEVLQVCCKIMIIRKNYKIDGNIQVVYSKGFRIEEVKQVTKNGYSILLYIKILYIDCIYNDIIFFSFQHHSTKESHVSKWKSCKR